MQDKSDAIRICWAHWHRDQAALRHIRGAVFIEEQQIPETLEWDGRDPGAIHVLAVTASGQAVGTARLLANGHIGRMAVLSAWRRRGVGTAMLRKLMSLAAATGRPTPFLNAQAVAIGFYERHGFIVTGPEFEEAGIPHRHMTLSSLANRK